MALGVGIDYAWADPKPSPAALKAAGVTFIARYLSGDPSKNLTQAELSAANAAGISVIVVWEAQADAMLGGYAAGAADASSANAEVNALGMTGVPIYFACDFDATPAQQVPINAYLDGVASVIGLARTGIYAGYYPVQRAFDAGKITYGWQTYAWSGGQWDTRAQARQVQNDVTVAGVSADWDAEESADMGQWPRPAPPVPSTSYNVSATPPGWWKAGTTCTLSGTGTDGKPWKTATTDGHKWTAPVPA